MRIIAGSLKGRTFRVPPGFPSRPTTDYAKEGLFNMLNNTYEFEGMKILDLCSGTGNISFEFLSRGAALVTSVDHHGKACTWLHKNAQQLQLDTKISVVNSDVLQFLERTDQQFDIIFADPPFDLKIHSSLVSLVFQRSVLQQEGLLIVEHGKDTSLDNSPYFKNMRNFGNVNFSFFVWP